MLRVRVVAASAGTWPAHLLLQRSAAAASASCRGLSSGSMTLFRNHAILRPSGGASPSMFIVGAAAARTQRRMESSSDAPPPKPDNSKPAAEKQASTSSADNSAPPLEKKPTEAKDASQASSENGAKTPAPVSSSDAPNDDDVNQQQPTTSVDKSGRHKPSGKPEGSANSTDDGNKETAPADSTSDSSKSSPLEEGQNSAEDAKVQIKSDSDGGKAKVSGGGSDGDNNKNKGDDKPPLDKDKPAPGFEHFFNEKFPKASATSPSVALEGISLTEELHAREIRRAQTRNRRWLYLVALGGFAGLHALYYGESSFIVSRFRNMEAFVPHTSLAAIDHVMTFTDSDGRPLVSNNAAADASLEPTSDVEAAHAKAEREALAKMREGSVLVRVDLDHKTARHFDEEGHLLGVTTYASIRAFKERLMQWRVAVTSTETTTNEAGEEVETTVTRQEAPTLMYGVPTSFPLVAICFLWLLPVLVSVHRGLTLSVRAAGVAANKAAPDAAKTSRFKLQTDVTTKLQDVAGLTEVKMEVTEIVHMLKHPQNYTKLGARVPRGVLIDGPPGVGKTLLAKAVAGEAALPFISCSGSEFDEVYVGVGAKRVRELFKTARENKPCVIFIDEIDTFGRKRRNDRSGSSRATINALLNELDGFTEQSDIMVLAATNRADTLDEALTRSGRFDRKISVDLPPHKDRVEIAKVHLKPLNLSPALTMDAMAETLATMTPGCSGADIYNVCNEAAITASREAREHVELECFYKALDRIMMGMEKRAKKLQPQERERIAFHEAGHVVLQWFLETPDPVLKATIVPRGGRSTGVTKTLPKERFISTQTMLRERMIHSLGGYVAEEHFFEDVSSSAADDLRKVTNMAHHEVATYGMDPVNIGHFGWQENENAVQKPYSNRKSEQIDAAVSNISDQVKTTARQMLIEHLDKVRIVAGLLLKNETVTARELWTILGERPVMSADFRKYLETAVS